VNAGALLATGLGVGLLAGATSCAAVQGGLLAGTVGHACHPGAAPGSGRRALVAFLAGKLAAYTALGALLGAAGALVQPQPRVQAVLVIAAGVAMAALAVGLAGIPVVPHRTSVPGRPSGRASRGGAPLLLGAATVLLPCGAALSMELLAATAGSPWLGALALAAFAAGTAPTLGVVGLALARYRDRLRGVLAAAVCVTLLAAAAVTVGAGLRLAGWAGVAGAAPVEASRAVARTPDGGQVITIAVRDDGYVPAVVGAAAGLPTTLLLRTDHAGGCVLGFVLPGRGATRVLPATGEVRVDLGRPGAGSVRFACAMGMYGGRIDFA
jgi:sulfite exporter TauE/SafE